MIMQYIGFTLGVMVLYDTIEGLPKKTLDIIISFELAELYENQYNQEIFSLHANNQTISDSVADEIVAKRHEIENKWYTHLSILSQLLILLFIDRSEPEFTNSELKAYYAIYATKYSQSKFSLWQTISREIDVTEINFYPDCISLDSVEQITELLQAIHEPIEIKDMLITYQDLWQC